MALSRPQRLMATPHSIVDKVKLKPLEVKLVNKEENKACMVIPKRYVAKACDRNKIRRVCLEFVRKEFKNRQIGGIMIRVYTVPDSLDTITSTLSRCINQLRC